MPDESPPASLLEPSIENFTALVAVSAAGPADGAMARGEQVGVTKAEHGKANAAKPGRVRLECQEFQASCGEFIDLSVFPGCDDHYSQRVCHPQGVHCALEALQRVRKHRTVETSGGAATQLVCNVCREVAIMEDVHSCLRRSTLPAAGAQQQEDGS